jgi:transposase
MTMRRKFTGDFKARVALEALRGDRTIQEIASKHKLHPNQISSWKRQAIEGLGQVFPTGRIMSARTMRLRFAIFTSRLAS